MPFAPFHMGAGMLAKPDAGKADAGSKEILKMGAINLNTGEDSIETIASTNAVEVASMKALTVAGNATAQNFPGWRYYTG